MLAFAERPEQDAVLPLASASQEDVLLRGAVDREREDRRLPAARAPVAALARRLDHGHGLGRALQPKGLLVQRRRR